MDRRKFMKIAVAGLLGSGMVSRVLAGSEAPVRNSRVAMEEETLKDYLFKMRHPDRPHPGDLYVRSGDCPVLASVVFRFRRIIKTVGYGNFSLLGFDEAVRVAKNYTRVGCFTGEELAFLEEVFYRDSSRYGFLDDKPLKRMTDIIQKGNVVKIPYSGNYLYRGQPLETYRRIKHRIGDKMILTSGLRSITKQFYLFLKKVHENHGNLSLASRSLAPPGYSFHGVGDFDVGQVNFGEFNFTEKFTDSGVYQKLTDLGYSGFRYPNGNYLGVRFEPWHIKVTDHQIG